MGAASLLVGAVALYENIEYWYYGIDATMELAETSKPLPKPSPGEDIYLLDLRYSAASSELILPRQWMDGEVARRLGNSEKIPIIYFKNRPQRILFSSDDVATPWGWLLGGIILMATFGYALKLLREEHEGVNN